MPHLPAEFSGFTRSLALHLAVAAGLLAVRPLRLPCAKLEVNVNPARLPNNGGGMRIGSREDQLKILAGVIGPIARGCGSQDLHVHAVNQNEQNTIQDKRTA